MVLDFLFNLFSYTYPCPKTLVFVTKIVGRKFFRTINRGVGLDDMAGYPRQNMECNGENSSHICRPKLQQQDIFRQIVVLRSQ